MKTTSSELPVLSTSDGSGESSEPRFNGISIVIPYYNDPEHIGRCLDAVEVSWQNLPQEDRQRVEVIIIDDHSTDPLSPPKIGLPCTVHRQEEKAGCGAARNKGAALASRNYVLFLDSDVILDERFLPRVFERLSGNAAAKVLQGPHSYEPADTSPSLFQRYLATSWFFYMSQELRGRHGEPGTFYSGAAVIERAFFLSLGGFSENYTSSGGEEFELSAKLSRCPAGTMAYDENLVTLHHSDSMTRRLGKLLWRSQTYLSTASKVSRLPLSFKIHCLLRLFFAFCMNLSLCAIPWKPFPAAATYAILYVLFGLVDHAFTRQMIRAHSWTLGLLSPLFRQLEYSAIGIGLSVGAIRKAINLRPFRDYEFLIARRPAYFIFWVTQNCNFKCRHCFNYQENEKSNNDLTLKEIRKIARNMGHLQYMTLAGGEPFLRRDLSEIVPIFYKHNRLRILNVVTNGWFEDRIKSFAESVLASCPDLYLNIAVSVDGLAERHDLIRLRAGSFDRAVSSLKMLKSLAQSPTGKRLSAVATSTYNKENANELEALSDHLSETCGVPLYVGLIRTKDVPDRNLLDVDLDHYREISRKCARNVTANLSKDYPFRNARLALEEVVGDVIYNSARNNKMTVPCKAGKKAFVLTADGDILLCEILNIRLGNVRESGYAPYRILDSDHAKREMDKIIADKCHCTWECFQRLNVVYSPSMYPKVISKALGMSRA